MRAEGALPPARAAIHKVAPSAAGAFYVAKFNE